MDKDPRAGSIRVLAIVERNIMENLQKQKNYGMELLRILAAVLVLQLHILGQGAIYPNTGASIVTAKYAVNYAVSWSLETAAYGAVDLFALISGFVGLYSGFKVKRWMRLWALCVFWGVTMFLLFDHGVAVVQAFDDLLLNMGLDVGPTVERLVATGMDYHDVIFTVGSSFSAAGTARSGWSSSISSARRRRSTTTTASARTSGSASSVTSSAPGFRWASSSGSSGCSRRTPTWRN